MRFLLTNDDGVDAPGLAVLAEVVRSFGEPVIVAPDVCHSAKSHAITMSGPLRVRRRKVAGVGESFACNGTPADCVRMAINRLSLGAFDVVISGINPGANCGVDVYYSGTVAAAREAALLGVPGIAVSQLVRFPDEPDWTATRRRAEAALRFLLCDVGRLSPLVSVNLPSPRVGEEERGVRVCRLALDPWPMVFSPPAADEDSADFETSYAGRYLDRNATEGGDFHLVTSNHITITPLRLDATDEHELERLRAARTRSAVASPERVNPPLNREC
ncbi:MAG: 5'/3'-nucleotidase SurE [Planctomycetota bacterium]|nr:MAG: 5'/3'-nucleotidase SurE [Planctomycetota bacterium]